MFLIKAVLILVWFAAVPFCMGSLPLFRTGSEKKTSWTECFVYGYAVMFALFELMALPAIFGGLSFDVLKYVYGCTCIILSVFSAVSWGKLLQKDREESGIGILTYIGREAGRKFQDIRNIPWTMWAAFVLIAIQVSAYVFGMATDLDDSFYVATATTTLETGGMFTHGAYTGRLVTELPSRYVLSPFPIMLAFYSDVVNMHPAAVAHTVQPVFFLLLSYAAYGLTGRKLFGENCKSTGFFLFFLALVQTFSYYSVYTQGTFMLIRIWQGKALLASFVLPAIFCCSRCCMQEEAERRDWIRMLCLMCSSCLVSSMGMMLAPIMLGIMTLLYGIPGWKWKKILAATACCIPNVLCAAVYLNVR